MLPSRFTCIALPGRFAEGRPCVINGLHLAGEPGVGRRLKIIE